MWVDALIKQDRINVLMGDQRKPIPVHKWIAIQDELNILTKKDKR